MVVLFDNEEVGSLLFYGGGLLMMFEFIKCVVLVFSKVASN